MPKYKLTSFKFNLPGGRAHPCLPSVTPLRMMGVSCFCLENVRCALPKLGNYLPPYSIYTKLMQVATDRTEKNQVLE